MANELFIALPCLSAGVALLLSDLFHHRLHRKRWERLEDKLGDVKVKAIDAQSKLGVLNSSHWQNVETDGNRFRAIEMRIAQLEQSDNALRAQLASVENDLRHASEKLEAAHGTQLKIGEALDELNGAMEIDNPLRGLIENIESRLNSLQAKVQHLQKRFPLRRTNG